jgi:hypothetical protein
MAFDASNGDTEPRLMCAFLPGTNIRWIKEITNQVAFRMSQHEGNLYMSKYDSRNISVPFQ